MKLEMQITFRCVYNTLQCFFSRLFPRLLLFRAYRIEFGKVRDGIGCICVANGFVFFSSRFFVV